MYDPSGYGYLGSSYECECGYIPAISHDHPNDCIKYLNRQLKQCKGETE
jgi:hypothetical protein